MNRLRRLQRRGGVLMTEALIRRARSLLAFLPEVEAAGVLMEGKEGVSSEVAYLAVKAARVLFRGRG